MLLYFLCFLIWHYGLLKSLVDEGVDRIRMHAEGLFHDQAVILTKRPNDNITTFELRR